MHKEKIHKKPARNYCIRCGTCCQKGGPVLHQEDKKIILDGYVRHYHLITIRKGELAFNPISNSLEQIQQELIKVAGKGDDWSCIFYNEKNSTCTIYKNRFIECRLLKCWDSSELMRIFRKNTLVRADIINPGDPVMKVIEMHEQECPCYEVHRLVDKISKGIDKSKNHTKLVDFIRKDMSIRSYALSELGLMKEFELFIFGRPLTEILSAHGFSVRLPNEKPVIRMK